MKNFRVEYHCWDESKKLYALMVGIMTAKELAEFIIDNAYNKRIMIKEVKKL